MGTFYRSSKSQMFYNCQIMINISGLIWLPAGIIVRIVFLMQSIILPAVIIVRNILHIFFNQFINISIQ